MDLRIAGKCALIGASGQGLGLACAKRLAAEGCNVAMCDINEEALNRGYESVVSANPGVTVKKYFRNGPDEVVLQPLNPAYPTIVLRAGDPAAREAVIFRVSEKRTRL